MTNVKFFLVVLVVTVVIVLAAAIGLMNADADTVVAGLLIAVVFSVFATLFRILKNSNDPDNRLGNWKYFFTLFVFLSGIIAAVTLYAFNDEEALPLSLVAGFVISSIMSIYRGIKHWHQKRKSEKQRDQQYQESLRQKNRQYAEELERKDRIIRDLKNRNSELQQSQRTGYALSSSHHQSDFEEEQRYREEQRREEQRKREDLESWYREYVTIEVDFDYHYIDSEYNQDYWERRSEEIRVTRREAIALIEAGEAAIIGRAGYNNRSLIRNISYRTPYRLYDRPWNC